MTREQAIIATATLLALALPAWLLRDATPSTAPTASASAPPLAVTAAPPLDHALQRPLFAESAPATQPAWGEAGGPPALVGIVGRLPDQAIALVRTADGGTSSLAVGAEAEGWRLESLSPDAALFTRGPERRRLALPQAP